MTTQLYQLNTATCCCDAGSRLKGICLCDRLREEQLIVASILYFVSGHGNDQRIVDRIRSKIVLDDLSIIIGGQFPGGGEHQRIGDSSQPAIACLSSPANCPCGRGYRGRNDQATNSAVKFLIAKGTGACITFPAVQR